MRNKSGIDCQKKHSDRTHDFHYPSQLLMAIEALLRNYHLVSLEQSSKHHVKDVKHGHIWPLVIYDHTIT